MRLPPLPNLQLTGILLPSKFLPFFQIWIHQVDAKLLGEGWWADSSWSHHSCLLGKTWKLNTAENNFACILLFTFGTQSCEVAWHFWFTFLSTWALTTMWSKREKEYGTRKLQAWVLRTQFALADVGLGKRLGSNPYSSCTLKQDFFWRGYEMRGYIANIFFPTGDKVWQWIGSHQRLLHFRLWLFRLFFRSGFKCQGWRFAPLLLHWLLGTERDKIQIMPREKHQFRRTRTKGSECGACCGPNHRDLSHTSSTPLTQTSNCTESSGGFTLVPTVLSFIN